MIEPAQLGAQIINFILLVALLYKLLYKPVRDFMDQRTAAIEQKIASAEENQAAAKALLSDLEKEAQASKDKARQFLEESARRAETLQAEMVAQAKRESQALLQRTQEEIRLEKEKAWEELKMQAGDLSLLLASKVIQETLDEKQHQHLIAKTLAHLDSLERKGAP